MAEARPIPREAPAFATEPIKPNGLQNVDSVIVPSYQREDHCRLRRLEVVLANRM